MLRTIRDAALAVWLAKLLRPRWRRITVCVGVAALAIYTHSEYLAFVDASDRQPLWWTFIVKNAVIVGALGYLVLAEIAAQRRSAKAAQGDARKTNWGTKPRPDPAHPPHGEPAGDVAERLADTDRQPRLRTPGDLILERHRNAGSSPKSNRSNSSDTQT